MPRKSVESGNLILGKLCHWREILVGKKKKYKKKWWVFCHTEGKFWTIFHGNVAFFPAAFINELSTPTPLHRSQVGLVASGFHSLLTTKNFGG